MTHVETATVQRLVRDFFYHLGKSNYAQGFYLTDILRREHRAQLEAEDFPINTEEEHGKRKGRKA